MGDIVKKTKRDEDVEVGMLGGVGQATNAVEEILLRGPSDPKVCKILSLAPRNANGSQDTVCRARLKFKGGLRMKAGKTRGLAPKKSKADL